MFVCPVFLSHGERRGTPDHGSPEGSVGRPRRVGVSLVHRISGAVAVVFQDRSPTGGSQCSSLRFIDCRTPASEVMGLRRVHNHRDAPTRPPAGQDTTIGLATRPQHLLLGLGLGGCSVGDPDLASGIRYRHRNPVVVGVRDRRCCECHADHRSCCQFLHRLPDTVSFFRRAGDLSLAGNFRQELGRQQRESALARVPGSSQAESRARRLSNRYDLRRKPRRKAIELGS